MPNEADPGVYTCSHQKHSHLRCATPSCPAGVSRRKYRVEIRENGQSAMATLQRVLTDNGWTWRLARLQEQS